MKSLRMKVLLSATLSLLFLGFWNVPTSGAFTRTATYLHPHHVLLISIDGLHAVDLANYTKAYPDSTMAKLSGHGVTYNVASTSRPSDSFPGILSLTTGGSPRSTGVYYDDSYDRTLSPPGSKCATVGTEVVYDESIDYNLNAIDGGGGINPAALPLDPAKGCTPVYPHSFLRVNTIFEVIKKAGLHTAWSDKHPAYDLLNGPSGKGVEDLYNPEVAANNAAGSKSAIISYDSLKVQAILNEIHGYDHTGKQHVGVPAIFGMNFQAVSAVQKLPTGGYTDALGTPSSDLLDAMNFVDTSLGKMVSELKKEGLSSSTFIILTAKHGQAPIDRHASKLVSNKLIPGIVNGIAKDLVAQATQDDVSLLWLSDQSKTDAAVAALSATESKTHLQQILADNSLKLLFGDPTKDPRTPDIIGLPNAGVIYAGSTATKIAEHGGFNIEDTHVALLISAPGLDQETIFAPVQTTQVAPTILKLLGLNPSALQAVRIEHTSLLPGLND